MNKETIYGKVKVVVKNGEYGVTDLDDNVIVPFGKYGWIEGFDQGLSRVRTRGSVKTKRGTHLRMSVNDILNGVHFGEAKWGIINEEGKEVLPVEYDSVWSFLGSGYTSTNVEKDGITRKVYFDVKHNRPTQITERGVYRRNYHVGNYYDYGASYSEYAGSYAQDVMGFSDEDIDDAFEGDPEAYWNID